MCYEMKNKRANSIGSNCPSNLGLHPFYIILITFISCTLLYNILSEWRQDGNHLRRNNFELSQAFRALLECSDTRDGVECFKIYRKGLLSEASKGYSILGLTQVERCVFTRKAKASGSLTVMILLPLLQFRQ